jgi:DNA (cytosine-5)-methyltransferase 1
VREAGAHNLSRTTLVAGGFPCQDVSRCNPRGEKLEGARSGLWSEFARIIGELRPAYALIENVTGLFNSGFERVLCDLAALRYDAEWTTLRASDFGYPHTRERLFIVAYPERERLAQMSVFVESYRRHLRKRQDARELPADFDAVHLEAVGRTYVRIPENLCVDDGLPARLVRPQIRGYGNAVVPEIAEWVGRRIYAHARLAESED